MYPDVRELLPHAGLMVWLTRVLEWRSGFVECEAQVRTCSEQKVNEWIDTSVTIEHMGQAVAACLGMEAFQQGEGARVGMIVGCKSFVLCRPELRVGQLLRVRATCVRGNESTSRFVCDVRDNDGEVSNATMLLFHPQVGASQQVEVNRGQGAA